MNYHSVIAHPGQLQGGADHVAQLVQHTRLCMSRVLLWVAEVAQVVVVHRGSNSHRGMSHGDWDSLSAWHDVHFSNAAARPAVSSALLQR